MSPAETLQRLADPKYFIERFFYIVDRSARKVPFLFNLPQQRYYEHRTPFDLILKARKEGFSTLIEAIWLHACMFFQNEKAVTMSHEMESTKRHFMRVKFFMTSMGVGEEIRMSIDTDKESEKMITFPRTNSSYWIGTAGAKGFGRGDDITRLHLSEVAHYENQTVLDGVLRACTDNAWRVMETTAKGVGELFHRTWVEASDPKSGSPWKPHFFAWYDDPRNRRTIPKGVTFRLTQLETDMKAQYELDDEQINWYRCTRAEMLDKSLMPQEHPSNPDEAFLYSGLPAFNLKKVQEMKRRARLQPPAYVGRLHDNGEQIEFIDDEDGELRIWEAPRDRATYLISADPAEGLVNGDFSVQHVFDRSNWKCVATYRKRIAPGQFGRAMVTLGEFYNNALLCPELNNHGWAVLEAIDAEKYPHVLQTVDLWGEDEPQKRGWPQTDKNRNRALTAARNAIDQMTVPIWDMQTLSEMETFVKNPNADRWEAMEGFHDDCVLSFMIGVYCLGHLTKDEAYSTYRESVQRRVQGSPIMTTSLLPKKQEGRGHRRRTGGW